MTIRPATPARHWPRSYREGQVFARFHRRNPLAVARNKRTTRVDTQPRETPAVTHSILVSDFDGTITRRDFYRLVLERLVPRNETAPDPWSEYRAGRLTHFDALNAVFQSARPGEMGLLEAARAMELDPRLKAGVDSLREAGWEVVVASAGCRWYIDRLLKEAEVTLEIHANPGTIRDGRLVMESNSGSPVFSFETGIDKAKVVSNAMSLAKTVAFAGDGYPDLPAALLVPSCYRFATGALADELERRGEAFRRFERWIEVAKTLSS